MVFIDDIVQSVERGYVEEGHANSLIEAPARVGRVWYVQRTIQVQSRREGSRSSQVRAFLEFLMTRRFRTVPDHSAERRAADCEYDLVRIERECGVFGAIYPRPRT